MARYGKDDRKTIVTEKADFERIVKKIKNSFSEEEAFKYYTACSNNDLEDAYEQLLLKSGAGWNKAEHMIKDIVADDIKDLDYTEDEKIDVIEEILEEPIKEITEEDLEKIKKMITKYDINQEEIERIQKEREQRENIREQFKEFITHYENKTKTVRVRRELGFVKKEIDNVEFEHYEYTKSNVGSVLSRYKIIGYKNLSEYQKTNLSYIRDRAKEIDKEESGYYKKHKRFFDLIEE